MIRRSASYAKLKVWDRDHGTCELCGTDTCADLKGPVVRFSGWPHSRALGRWDMDHRIPVAEGGGSCGLENLRTLCKPCHKRVTAELRKRLANPA